MLEDCRSCGVEYEEDEGIRVLQENEIRCFCSEECLFLWYMQLVLGGNVSYHEFEKDRDKIPIIIEHLTKYAREERLVTVRRYKVIRPFGRET